MSRSFSLAALLLAIPALFSPLAHSASLPVIEEKLVAPPFLPPPIVRSTPAKVVVNLTVEEVEREIAPGTRYTFWTFGGTVPGKAIRVREGDTVELHLKNLSGNKLPHNIDLHAVSGPGGGAAQTLIAPGNQASFTFKALNPGVFVYHCATAPVGMHVANGMYGLIVVEPKEGLPKVDREYYVMQGDFYTNGGYRASGLQPFDMQKAVDERPTYVLFNGAEGALTGKNALTAKVGEKVRLFYGDGGPNLTSSFHVIGAIFDKVYSEGGFNHYLKDVQTTMVPAGGSSVVEFTPKVPGNLTLVDHSLTRAFNKGAIGIISVSGAESAEIYSKGVITPLGKDDADVRVALKQSGLIKTSLTSVAPPAPNNGAAQLKRGQQVFSSVCAACHGADGKGVEGVFPPLANSDFFKERPYEMAHIVIHGRSGEIVVNGKHYNNVMPPQDLSEEDIASVINYVNIDLNGGKPVITPQQVHEMRQVKQ